MKTRITAILLTLLLVISLIPAAAFAADFKFTDVPQSAWYYEEVKKAFEMGLVSGKSDTKYCPNDNLTFAEAVKLAACMNQRYYTGAVYLTDGSPWYASYAEYAKAHNIISSDPEWKKPADRASVARLFVAAFPAETLEAKNNIPDGSIPDVPMTHPDAKAIYTMYRAGILQGNEEKDYEYRPASNIRRSEVAALLARLMDPAGRLSFTTAKDEYTRPETGGSTEVTRPGSEGSSYGSRPSSGGTESNYGSRPSTGGTEGNYGSRPSTRPVEADPITVSCRAAEVADTADDAVVLSVSVTGGVEPYTYRWQYKSDTRSEWNSYRSKTDSTASVTGKDGCYFRCVITDAQGNVGESTTIALTVRKPYIYREPEDQVIPYGYGADLSVGAKYGTGSLAYIWQRNIEGYPENQWINYTEPSSSSEFSAACASNYIYRCVVIDEAGNQAVSRVVRLTPPPMKIEKISYTFDYTAENNRFNEAQVKIEVSGGSGLYKYQWQFKDNYGNWKDFVLTGKKEYGKRAAEYCPFAIGDEVRCIVTDSATGKQIISDVLRRTN